MTGWTEWKDGPDTCFVCGKVKDQILQMGTDDDTFASYFRICDECLSEAEEGGEME